MEKKRKKKVRHIGRKGGLFPLTCEMLLLNSSCIFLFFKNIFTSHNLENLKLLYC